MKKQDWRGEKGEYYNYGFRDGKLIAQMQIRELTNKLAGCVTIESCQDAVDFNVKKIQDDVVKIIDEVDKETLENGKDIVFELKKRLGMTK